MVCLLVRLNRRDAALVYKYENTNIYVSSISVTKSNSLPPYVPTYYYIHRSCYEICNVRYVNKWVGTWEP